jgi:hypothetical protein
MTFDMFRISDCGFRIFDFGITPGCPFANCQLPFRFPELRRYRSLTANLKIKDSSVALLETAI